MYHLIHKVHVSRLNDYCTSRSKYAIRLAFRYGGEAWRQLLHLFFLFMHQTEKSRKWLPFVCFVLGCFCCYYCFITVRAFTSHSRCFLHTGQSVRDSAHLRTCRVLNRNIAERLRTVAYAAVELEFSIYIIFGAREQILDLNIINLKFI